MVAGWCDRGFTTWHNKYTVLFVICQHKTHYFLKFLHFYEFYKILIKKASLTKETKIVVHDHVKWFFFLKYFIWLICKVGHVPHWNINCCSRFWLTNYGIWGFRKHSDNSLLIHTKRIYSLGIISIQYFLNFVNIKLQKSKKDKWKMAKK